MVDEELLAIIRCPVCTAPLRLENNRLVCTRTQVAFPIENHVPILLAERAEPAHPDDRSQPHDTTA